MTHTFEDFWTRRSWVDCDTLAKVHDACRAAWERGFAAGQDAMGSEVVRAVEDAVHDAALAAAAKMICGDDR